MKVVSVSVLELKDMAPDGTFKDIRYSHCFMWFERTLNS